VIETKSDLFSLDHVNPY